MCVLWHLSVFAAKINIDMQRTRRVRLGREVGRKHVTPNRPDADLWARPATEVRRVLAVFSPDARMAATDKLVDFIVDKAIADGNVGARAPLARSTLC